MSIVSNMSIDSGNREKCTICLETVDTTRSYLIGAVVVDVTKKVNFNSFFSRSFNEYTYKFKAVCNHVFCHDDSDLRDPCSGCLREYQVVTDTNRGYSLPMSCPNCRSFFTKVLVANPNTSTPQPPFKSNNIVNNKDLYNRLISLYGFSSFETFKSHIQELLDDCSEIGINLSDSQIYNLAYFYMKGEEYDKAIYVITNLVVNCENICKFYNSLHLFLKEKKMGNQIALEIYNKSFQLTKSFISYQDLSYKVIKFVDLINKNPNMDSTILTRGLNFFWNKFNDIYEMCMKLEDKYRYEKLFLQLKLIDISKIFINYSENMDYKRTIFFLLSELNSIDLRQFDFSRNNNYTKRSKLPILQSVILSMLANLNLDCAAICRCNTQSQTFSLFALKNFMEHFYIINKIEATIIDKNDLYSYEDLKNLVISIITCIDTKNIEPGFANKIINRFNENFARNYQDSIQSFEFFKNLYYLTHFLKILGLKKYEEKELGNLFKDFELLLSKINNYFSVNKDIRIVRIFLKFLAEFRRENECHKILLPSLFESLSNEEFIDIVEHDTALGLYLLGFCLSQGNAISEKQNDFINKYLNKVSDYKFNDLFEFFGKARNLPYFISWIFSDNCNKDMGSKLDDISTILNKLLECDDPEEVILLQFNKIIDMIKSYLKTNYNTLRDAGIYKIKYILFKKYAKIGMLDEASSYLSQLLNYIENTIEQQDKSIYYINLLTKDTLFDQSKIINKIFDIFIYCEELDAVDLDAVYGKICSINRDKVLKLFGEKLLKLYIKNKTESNKKIVSDFLETILENNSEFVLEAESYLDADINSETDEFIDSIHNDISDNINVRILISGFFQNSDVKNYPAIIDIINSINDSNIRMKAVDLVKNLAIEKKQNITQQKELDGINRLIKTLGNGRKKRKRESSNAFPVEKKMKTI